MTTAGPRVAEVWRYPVKSMLGEQLDAVAVGERGLAGDRGYALVDRETGSVASAKHPSRWARLFELRAAYLEPPDGAGELPPVRITLPGGESTRSDDADADDVLSAVLGRAVQLVAHAPETVEIEQPVDADVSDAAPAPVKRGQIALLAPGTFFDCAPVHLVTTASLAALGAANASSVFDVKRFRPNVLVDAGPDATGFVENAWVDRRVRIGAELALDVLLSAPRCVMTTLAQPGLPADKAVLQTVARANRFEIPGLGPSSCVGVYAIVGAGGTVACGDPVSLPD